MEEFVPPPFTVDLDLKPAFRDVELKDQPLLLQGVEASGLCSIMWGFHYHKGGLCMVQVVGCGIQCWLSELCFLGVNFMSVILLVLWFPCQSFSQSIVSYLSIFYCDGSYCVLRTKFRQHYLKMVQDIVWKLGSWPQWRQSFTSLPCFLSVISFVPGVDRRQSFKMVLWEFMK